MKLIINNSSMQPIYEQIVAQVRNKIMQGELEEDTALPSVRTLAKDLRVSALTVKKAYDTLEQEGFVVTVHGKGSSDNGSENKHGVAKDSCIWRKRQIFDQGYLIEVKEARKYRGLEWQAVKQRLQSQIQSLQEQHAPELCG